jgi:hypothetical protein
VQETRFEPKKTFRRTLNESLGNKIMNEKFLLIGRDWVPDSFKTLVDRKIRERRRNERRLAEQRTTRHQLPARNSCIADARSYRVARRLPVPHAAEFDWNTLIPVERLNKAR